MIVAGFGFRGTAGVDSLRDALAHTAAPELPVLLATATDKAATAVFRSFARDMDLPIRAVAPADLACQTTATTSAVSQIARGTGSVAEAAALAAAGPGARLLGPRVVSSDRMATCALAEGGDT